MTRNERAETLRDLILLRAPVVETAARLSSFSWDSEEELVMFTRGDTQRILDAYLSGVMQESEVQDWANVLEARDDIGFEAGSEDILKEFIFRLANPEIKQPLNHEAAVEQRRLLE